MATVETLQVTPLSQNISKEISGLQFTGMWNWAFGIDSAIVSADTRQELKHAYASARLNEDNAGLVDQVIMANILGTAKQPELMYLFCTKLPDIFPNLQPPPQSEVLNQQPDTYTMPRFIPAETVSISIPA